MDWSNYPNFERSEFECSHSGKCEMNEKFMEILQKIRTEYGKPIIISSGYRDVTHPVEVIKAQPGEHAEGMAADIYIRGTDALKLLELALKHGVKRIGLHQQGSSRFIHLGISDSFPAGIWTY